MATTPAIFPSVSRNYSMDGSQTCEDDTVRDSMESGYVATRPRFTRARRTWKANLRYISIEDVRSLQHFRDEIVLRGALSFYLPNLVKNGSLEILAEPGDYAIADQWEAPELGGDVAISSQAFDGNMAALCTSLANQDATGINTTIGGLLYTGAIAANPGDTLAIGYAYKVLATTQPLYIEAALLYQYEGGNEQTFSIANVIGSGINATWQQGQSILVVPPPADGVSTLKYLTVRLLPHIEGSSTSPTLAAGEISVLLDSIGVAVIATAQKQAYMLGGSSVPRPVRFTKLPEFADLGWVGGTKRFGCTFEVSEL